MSFALPWFLGAGALAALTVLALHFLAREEPVRWVFPTARFVPESREQAPSRSLALRDRLLLLLRLLAVACAALGFARPSFTAARPPLARVILADFSRAVRDTAEVGRAVTQLRGTADTVIQFGAGGISAALIVGIRTARGLRDAADSIAIVLVSPLAREEFDAATPAVRRTWPGGIAWHRVAAADASVLSALALRAPAEDPLRATLALAGIPLADDAPVRLVREAGVSAADSAWVREPSHLLLHWPAGLGAARDTIGAVVTARTVLVAAFPRPAATAQGVPVAWWADGAVAATEQPAGGGCVRTVSIPIDPVGDLALREPLRALLRDLLVPCGGARDLRPADSAAVETIRGAAPAAVAATTLPPLATAGRGAAPWLLGLGVLLLVAEQLLRRRGGAS